MKKLALAIVLVFVLVFPALADKVLDVPVINLDFIRFELGTQYDCGVGVMDEVFAYYDQWEDIVTGEATGSVPENTDYILDLHDYLMDHSGFTGSWVLPATLAYWFEQYFTLHNVSVNITHDTSPTWNEVVTEIDADRPVPLVIYGANHYVLVIGYKTDPNRVVVLWNHDPEVREFTITQLVSWWPLETWYIHTDIEMGPPIPPVTPYNESWYQEAKAWCDANGWEIEIED
jgi:hypothetical protein